MKRLNQVQFYGERGLVNGLVLDLCENLDLTKELLRSICFCESQPPSWIDKIQQVKYLIEPSFAEFGDPDLIMICDCIDGIIKEKHVVFIEAKVVRYEDSAVDMEKEGVLGINSRINAQLTLRYRLSQALKYRKPGDAIKEDDQFYEAYSMLAIEKNGRPRSVKKPLTIRLCDEFLTGASEFWFVALTKDENQNPSFSDPRLRPVILNSAGKNTWNYVKRQFGIITYNVLDKLLDPYGNYAASKKYFMSSFNSTAGKRTDKDCIKTVNWSGFNTKLGAELRKRLQKIIENAIDNATGAECGKNCRVQHSGSDSYLCHGRTIIKLIPQHAIPGEIMLLAVDNNLAQAAQIIEPYFPEGPFEVGIGQYKREFVVKTFKDLPSPEEQFEYTAVLEELWKMAVEQ